MLKMLISCCNGGRCYLTAEFPQLLDQVCREEINGVILLGFVYDIFDLVLDFFVFSKLSLQEFEGYSGFLFEVIGCQRVGVGDLAWGAFKSFDFDDALVAEFREDVVGFPQADAHSFGHFPLSKFGVPWPESSGGDIGFLVRKHCS